MKYGAGGGWIGVKASASSREVHISVADRGMGVPAAEQTRIFEPFYRAPNAIEAQIQGAGLGLSLVQRIVEVHGGRITVRSDVGQGSEFTVHLPAASEDTAYRTSGAPDPAPRLP
jgi:signal transduction histidine kinase